MDKNDKDALLAQMRAELYDTSCCKSDFEDYDVKNIGYTTEPFLWMCRRYGTSMMSLGPCAVERMFDTQSKRLELFRDFDAYLDVLNYYSNQDDFKCFYWNGLQLIRVTMGEVFKVYEAHVTEYYEKIKERYPEEVKGCDTFLDVKFHSEDSEREYGRVKNMSMQMGDNSFLMCIQRLKERKRVSLDEHIMLSKDRMDNSFYFEFVVDGKVISNGGIIYHEYKEDNKWEIHT